ncbi:NADH-quinone oxidoreductase, E subunit [Spirochaeta thermophila DSM 6578]|uniref:NADH-quinone oxidoreductase, E subunit n=1 Tax=Winmispira thermophila (strain ATCC 700085 / DSM 6578 / Z-1203) TaxID=869211 RepID=G0GA82_WINT7|nr:NADH-quinone oxidoreductase subunit NuoE [Spirochaeta thermophila]AEJ60918.1 NADH-quinone oxidoreductase, E subunit [Spirochaeta thermophila DSM 6578]
MAHIDRPWKAYPPRRDNLLLILHDIQDHNPRNYLPDEEVEEVARYLGIPVSELDGIISFYSMFSRRPRGRYVIRMCDSLACRLAGSLDLYFALQEGLGIKRGQTTPDGLFTVELVNCLGCCDKGPSLMVNDELHTRMTREKLDLLLEELARREGVAYEPRTVHS